MPDPRLFALPCGVDFASELVLGLDARFPDLTHAQIYVNTARMQRRLRAVFASGPPRLVPHIRLVTDLGLAALQVDIPAPIAPLRRRLELTKVIARLLDADPSLAPRAALFDLADSLARLMDEMHGEGVPPAAISALDVTDQSGHWQRALKILEVLTPYFAANQDAPDQEARQRMVIEALVAGWAAAPPAHPIIIAGSTGSRGATALLMEAVARLPKGAVVLPGFDFEMPDSVWGHLDDPLLSEDHPQFRFQKLLNGLALSSKDVERWTTANPPSASRNQLISLALRPAPVTDQWRKEGPALGDLVAATDDLTLIEAASPRAEAEAVALRLRQAAEDGITAALITPDRMLTRQVSAALDRWQIVPDDSAGMPLKLSAPGRFLRQIVDAMGRPMQAEALLALLKHPLCHTGHAARNTHLLLSRELELRLRRFGPPVISSHTIREWRPKTSNDHLVAWKDWLAHGIDLLSGDADRPLEVLLDRHLAVAAHFAAGPQTEESGELYDQAAGRETARVVQNLKAHADAGGTISLFDYRAFFASILDAGVVRDRDAGHPNILIWGTLEARVGGADLMILAGLNEGTWPEAPSPDPWLNRKLRLDAGLLLPERRIGLSAHDFQQAVAGREVVLSRSKRSAEAETVPSRWLNRLTNLLSGLPKTRGPDALAGMKARGDVWLSNSASLSVPENEVGKAKRPSPRPPVGDRPKNLSVTQIKTLVRDPYAIYARKVLRLEPLDPLQVQADAPLRGTIFHAILEEFIAGKPDAADPTSLDRLNAIAARRLAEECPWPTVRLQWLTRMRKVAPAFLADEALRQSLGQLLQTETRGQISVGATGVTLTGIADRIDATPDGHAIVYDYKTGQVPTVEQQKYFDKQLLLTAAMVERGAFGDAPMPVADAAFLGVNTSTKTVKAPLEKLPADQVWQEFITLLDRWATPTQGYTARLALFSKTDRGQFDHLSRFGEWTMADTPEPEDMA